MSSNLLTAFGTEWRAKAVDAAAWKETGEERPGGESEGFWVTRDGLRGYLKPSKPDAADLSHPRAAHEKIAADLAFDLGLPVPPAILVDGKACGGVVQPAVVSLVLYREVHKLTQAVETTASRAIAHHILRSTRATWSGIIAFDAWLANSDRSTENVVIGIDASLESPLAEPVFCDFSNSMLHSQWKKGVASTVALSSVLPVMMDFLDREAAFATAEKIKSFAVETIAEVVNRIPETHLKSKDKEVVVESLAARSKAVPDVVAASIKRG